MKNPGCQLALLRAEQFVAERATAIARKAIAVRHTSIECRIGRGTHHSLILTCTRPDSASKYSDAINYVACLRTHGLALPEYKPTPDERFWNRAAEMFWHNTAHLLGPSAATSFDVPHSVKKDANLAESESARIEEFLGLLIERGRRAQTDNAFALRIWLLAVAHGAVQMICSQLPAASNVGSRTSP